MRRAPSSAEVEPAHAGEEQHGRERGAVDERGAEVGLEEDERHRHEPEADGGRAPCRAASTRRPRSTRKPAIASTKNVLPNSEGWNWNGPSVDPPLRAAHRLGEHEDEEHERRSWRRRANPPVALVERRRDEDRDDHAGDAEAGGDRLPGHVVVGVAGDVEAGDPADRPQPVGRRARAAASSSSQSSRRTIGPDVEDAEGRRAEAPRAGDGCRRSIDVHQGLGGAALRGSTARRPGAPRARRPRSRGRRSRSRRRRRAGRRRRARSRTTTTGPRGGRPDSRAG